MKEIYDIIDKVRDSIETSWEKIGSLTGKTDFIAVVEPSRTETSIHVLPRESGLTFLTGKGCDINHPSLNLLTEPAFGLTRGAMAIWVVVLHEEKAFVAKIIRQHMTQGGQA